MLDSSVIPNLANCEPPKIIISANTDQLIILRIVAVYSAGTLAVRFLASSFITVSALMGLLAPVISGSPDDFCCSAILKIIGAGFFAVNNSKDDQRA